MQQFKILVFAPWSYGHHPVYLKYLIEYWKKNKPEGSLSIVTLPSFLRNHPDVIKLTLDINHQGIQFIPMTEQEEKIIETQRSGLLRAVNQYRLIKKYSRKLNADHILALYFDSCLLPFAFRVNLPCPISGIYFRPTFHYKDLGSPSQGWLSNLMEKRQIIVLKRAMNHPNFHSLFCLDPFAIDPINHLVKSQKYRTAIYLPDPIRVEGKDSEISITSKNLKQKLKIEPHRRIFLAAGRLADPGKGTFEVLKAIQYLPEAVCRNICILLVGQPQQEGQRKLDTVLDPIIKKYPIQVIKHYGFVNDNDLGLYFHMADVILAPYQRHIGMSGILLSAAAYQKPALASNYGLMGAMARKYRIGLAIDSTNPREIANGMIKLCQEDLSNFIDKEKFSQLIQNHSAEKFSETIFNSIIRHESN